MKTWSKDFYNLVNKVIDRDKVLKENWKLLYLVIQLFHFVVIFIFMHLDSGLIVIEYYFRCIKYIISWQKCVI